jgi:hypothetical protein
MYGMFNECTALKKVPELDMRNCTAANNMFYKCTNLQEIWIKNIDTKLDIGSGTSYGHLLTLDSLLHVAKELLKKTTWDPFKTLTIGTANLEKLANVYVKLIDITDEMRAEDELIDRKCPFEVCESTDEGAMLITDYISTLKDWTIN